MISLFKKKEAPVYPADTVTSRDGRPIVFTFFKHASLAVDFDGRRIYVDPVGEYADYAHLPKADAVLVIKEIKDWEFVRDENGNIVVDESHPDWWQDKKDPDRHGIRIPVLDENGNQKVGARNRKQWKRVLTDATGWNSPKNCELWRSEWANVCNSHLKTENHIDHRSYARQGKLEIPTIHEEIGRAHV